MHIRLKLLWLCVLSAVVLAFGCSDDEGASTKVEISIEADLMLSKKLTRVEVETYDSAQTDASGKPTPVGTKSFAIKTEGGKTGYTFPFSFGAVKNKADSFLLVVIGFEGDNAVVEQKALIGFVAGQSRTHKVYLTTACYQKLCAERNASTWLQTTCDSTQGTCGNVTMSTPIVTGEDDAGAISTDGSTPSEAGASTTDAQAGNGNDSGSSMDGGRGNTSEAGAMDGAMDGASNASDSAQQLDTGSSASDSGPKDAGPTIDAQPVSCGTLTCPATANCVSTPTPHCECKPGYQGSGTTCTNINDCTATSCAAPSTCVDGIADFTCMCAAGYVQATPKTCTQQVQFASISSGGDSVGGGTNCARRTNSTTVCWGRNIYGQFGNGEETQDNNIPVVVAPLAGAVEIAVGSNFVCNRHSDGTVWCSGSNSAGQLGRGVAGGSTVPVQVSGLSTAVELAAGAQHICARRSDGTVVCWGDNTSGELGNGMAGAGMMSLAPVAVVGLTGAQEIAAGVYHTCARRSETSGGSSVVCWGSNNSGQLGNGTAGGDSGGAIVQVTTTTAFINPIGLALGEWHSCALLMSGAVWCWGADSAGQLGNALSDTTIPDPVSGLSGAVEVAANRFYSCARLMDGSVSCWGDWPGTTTTARQTKVVSGAVEIGAGYLHTCVRKNDGSIVCWGQNKYGQLGNGVTPTVEPPYTVMPVTVRTN